MKGRERGATGAGHRVQLFLDAHADEIGRFQVVPPRKDLDAAVAKLEAYEAEQLHATNAAKGETAVQKQMREDIYLHFLSPIAGAAKLTKLNEPGLFIYKRIDSHGEFLAQLELLVAVARPHEQVLVDHGAPRDFISRLRNAIDALRASTDARAQHWSNRSGATAGLEAANQAVRVEIDLIGRHLKATLLKNPALMAAWETSSKIHKARVEPRRGGSVELPDDEENST